MALTKSESHNDFDHLEPGRARVWIGTLNLGAGISSGGLAVSAADFDADASSILGMICEVSQDRSTDFSYDRATGKIEGTTISDGSEATGDLSGAGKTFEAVVFLA